MESVTVLELLFTKMEQNMRENGDTIHAPARVLRFLQTRTNMKVIGYEVTNTGQVCWYLIFYNSGLCQVHMSNLPPISPSQPVPNTKENRLSKALKRLSVKRSSGGSVRGAQNVRSPVLDNSTMPKLVEYIAYYQVWDNGKKVSETEIQPHDGKKSFITHTNRSTKS